MLLSVTNASVADKMTVLETDGLEVSAASGAAASHVSPMPPHAAPSLAWQARLRAALVLLTKQVEVAKMFTKIRSEVASQLKTGQRRFYLRQQLRAIQKELGEGEGEEAGALQELEDRLEAAELPPAAEKVCLCVPACCTPCWTCTTWLLTTVVARAHLRWRTRSCGA